MSDIAKCIVCNKTEDEIPVVEVKFKNRKFHICTQHIPVLIHKPQQLNELIPGIPEEEV